MSQRRGTFQRFACDLHLQLKVNPIYGGTETIAIVHLAPTGWSLICDRVKNVGWFNDLLNVADRLEEAVGRIKQA